MNIKSLFFICFVIQVFSVKCDCEDYFKCFGDFLSEFIGGVAKNDDKIDFFNVSDINSSEIIDVGDANNTNTGFFEILDLQRGLDEVLEEVMGLLRDEIGKSLQLETEYEVFKTIYNDSQIHVKPFDVGKKLVNAAKNKENIQQIKPTTSYISHKDVGNETENRNMLHIETSGILVNKLGDKESNTSVASRYNIPMNDTETIKNYTQIVIPTSKTMINTGNETDNRNMLQIETSGILVNKLGDIESNTSVSNISSISYSNTETKQIYPQIVTPVSGTMINIFNNTENNRTVTARPEIFMIKLPSDTNANKIVTPSSEITRNDLRNDTESNLTISEVGISRSEIMINVPVDTENKTSTHIGTTKVGLTNTSASNDKNNNETFTEIVTHMPLFQTTTEDLIANTTNNKTSDIDKATILPEILINNVPIVNNLPNILSDLIKAYDTIKGDSLEILKNETGIVNAEKQKGLKSKYENIETIKETTIIENISEKENKLGIEHLTTKSSQILTEGTTKEPVVIETLTFAPFKPLIDPLNYLSTAENEITDYSDLDYLIEDDNCTDYPIIDYVELYKDTTNEDVYYIQTEVPTITNINNFKDGNSDLNVIEYSVIQEEVLHNDITYSALQNDTSPAVFPWIATIFVKSESTDQFNYFCDGALLSENVVLTAARCVLADARRAGNFIIFLGKRSLQAATDGETLHKVKEVIVHENFTNEDGNVKNDLALLVLEDPATYSDRIQPACLQGVQDLKEALTTAWAPSGDLTIIPFEKEIANECEKKNKSENTFCATYGHNVALCPSYGGVYADRQTGNWCLQGIRTDDPTNRGFCIEKTVLYTALNAYMKWIDGKIDLNKL